VSAKLAQIDWETWFYKPGFPPRPDFDTSLVDVAYRLADQWEQFTTDPKNADFAPAKSDIHSWTANQLVVFLERVLAFKKALPAQQAGRMGDIYALKQTRNVEVSARYYQVAMASGDRSIEGYVVKLLGQVGRMKFVRPLYRALIKLDYEVAVDTFEKNKDFYHPICRGLVAKDLFGDKQQ
jgi:leukotriene-A4 hydrolase